MSSPVFSEKDAVQNQLITQLTDQGWHYVSPTQLREYYGRGNGDVIIASELEKHLRRLNPVINSVDRLSEYLSILENRILSAATKGTVIGNAEFSRDLKGQRTYRFHGEPASSTIHLIDLENPADNSFMVTEEVRYNGAHKGDRFDVVLWVNGIPIVVIECKEPKVSWEAAANDFYNSYLTNSPAFFASNVFLAAYNGIDCFIGSVGQPPHLWSMWGSTEDDFELIGHHRAVRSIELLVQPTVVLDVLRYFTLYRAGQTGSMQKILPRYVQHEAANAILERSRLAGSEGGLIAHFQGTGKTLLMAMTASRLIDDPAMNGPTIVVVVDRIDLDENVRNTFRGTGVKDLHMAEDSAQLIDLLNRDTRGVILTTVFKFRQAPKQLNNRENIVVMVDEAHRTQYGELGSMMRAALPNAKFFGMTGTPINTGDRNTYEVFGSELDADDDYVLSLYDMPRALADGVAVPIMVEPRLVEWNLDAEGLKQAFDEMLDNEDEYFDDDAREFLTRKASGNEAFFKNEKRVQEVCGDILDHFTNKIAPSGFKAQVVAYDRDVAVMYEEELNKLIRKRGLNFQTQVVMSTRGKDDSPEWLERYGMSREEEANVLSEFNRHEQPPHILIVTAKLLTGFDAPIEQALYLDRPLKAHTLFQAITRTNRLYRNPVTGQRKERGIIVDYVGLGEAILESLQTADPYSKTSPIDINGVIRQLQKAMSTALERFKGIDRNSADFTALDRVRTAGAAPLDDDVYRSFVAEFTTIQGLWETVAPHEKLKPMEKDYAWLATIYEMAKPRKPSRELLWQRMGAKTLELVSRFTTGMSVSAADRLIIDEGTIAELSQLVEALKVDGENENTTVDLATITATDVLESIDKRIKRRLAGSERPSVYEDIIERLERLRERSVRTVEQTRLFIEEALEIVRRVKAAEREDDAEVRRYDNTRANGGTDAPVLDPNIGKLTQIVAEYRPDDSTEAVQLIAEDIDAIASEVSFTGWTTSDSGDKEVKRELRSVLGKYQLPKSGELFQQVYEYVRAHY